jgi:hypothetical protein
MRETCTSGSTRGEVRSFFFNSLPLLLYRHPIIVRFPRKSR